MTEGNDDVMNLVAADVIRVFDFDPDLLAGLGAAALRWGAARATETRPARLSGLVFVAGSSWASGDASAGAEPAQERLSAQRAHQ